MRVVVYLLIAVNLLYLAWAGWIDTPAPPPPEPVKQGDPLPTLVLAREDISRPARSTTAVLSEPAPSAASASQCVSVGPFSDLAQAARAAALLKDRGFEPRQRAEPGGVWAGYWVYVDGLPSSAEETKLIKALEKAGIDDAQPMRDSADGRRVSVGLFSERDRAERRAQAVKRLGYDTEITERQQAATVYWVDMDIGSPERSVPTEGLLSLENAGSRLEVRVCPASNREQQERPGRMPGDARPASTTADVRSPRPS